MSVSQKSVRQFLSRLKNRLVSHDLQDIYQFEDSQLAALSGGSLPDDPSMSGAAKITYRIYDSLDVLEFVERIQPMCEQARSFATDRLEAGDMAVIGFLGETPVFYGWLMFDEIEMTYGVFAPIPQGMAFSYNLHTDSSHRRLGAMTGFYRFVSVYLKQHNIHTLYVGITTNNDVSIKAHLRNGFEKMGYFYTIKILGKGFTLARFEHAKRFYLT